MGWGSVGSEVFAIGEQEKSAHIKMNNNKKDPNV
jgi:hypothetical protein